MSRKEIIKLAKKYNVDQSQLLESFLCELLNVSWGELYEILATEGDD